MISENEPIVTLKEIFRGIETYQASLCEGAVLDGWELESDKAAFRALSAAHQAMEEFEAIINKEKN